jgi:hypothetical protein
VKTDRERLRSEINGILLSYIKTAVMCLFAGIVITQYFSSGIWNYIGFIVATLGIVYFVIGFVRYWFLLKYLL